VVCALCIDSIAAILAANNYIWKLVHENIIEEKKRKGVFQEDFPRPSLRVEGSLSNGQSFGTQKDEESSFHP
jgi:hypothetical protein